MIYCTYYLGIRGFFVSVTGILLVRTRESTKTLTIDPIGYHSRRMQVMSKDVGVVLIQ